VPADPGPTLERSARTILIADAIWDALLGTCLIIATVNSATVPVSAPALRPWLLFAVLAAACLAGAAFLLYLSTRQQAATACRSISPANMAATIAAIALLLISLLLPDPEALHVRTRHYGELARLHETAGDLGKLNVLGLRYT
jgi:hypothetical protein